MASVIIAMPKADDAKKIGDIINRYSLGTVTICTSAAQALASAVNLESGVIICSYKIADMHYTQLKEYLPEDFSLLLLSSLTELDYVPNDIMVVSYPIKVSDLVNTTEMLLEQIRRRIKKRKSQPKKRTPEEQRIIDEAKALLMERNHMTEPDAFRYIQKCSMDSGTNLVETAQMVLLLISEENHG